MFLSVQEFMTFTSQLIVERSAKGSRASVKEQGKRTRCLVRVPHHPSRPAPGSPELPAQALPRAEAPRTALPCCPVLSSLLFALFTHGSARTAGI